jgi:hypothetical protein
MTELPHSGHSQRIFIELYKREQFPFSAMHTIIDEWRGSGERNRNQGWGLFPFFFLAIMKFGVLYRRRVLPGPMQRPRVS